MNQETHSFSDLVKKIHSNEEIGRRLASMTTIADVSHELLKSIEARESQFQALIQGNFRRDIIYQSLNSIGEEVRKYFASMQSVADVSRAIYDELQMRQGHLQSIVNATNVSFNSSLNSLAEQSTELARRVQATIRLPFDQITRGMDSALALSRVWQSSQIADLASKLILDSSFRDSFIDRLEAEMRTTPNADIATVSDEQLLEAVEYGIKESEVARTSSDVQTSLNRLFSWWETLHPDLRTLIISLFVAILQFVVEHSLSANKQAPSLTFIKQRVKIVQNITNNYFVTAEVPRDKRTNFRIVKKDGLPVFRSRRLDSERVAILPGAQLVIVKDRKRNWTLIEWKDTATQKMASGWVLTRYLKKI